MLLFEGYGGKTPMKVPYTMAGKCGGMVYQNARHGQICYPAKPPANPNTQGQRRVRKNFAKTGKGWGPLGDWKQQLWIEEGATKLTRKRLGQCWPMTGWNYYIQVNQRRANRGLPPLDVPPEYLQRLNAALAATIAVAGAAQPLLGPALFLHAGRMLLTAAQPPRGVLAGRPPPG